MNYLVVDDEPFALEALEEALKETLYGTLNETSNKTSNETLNETSKEPPEDGKSCELSCFTSPGRALKYAETAVIDVAFLDIELGSMNGLVLAKKLKDLQPKMAVIFVTGYSQYAVGAFRLHASGYLMKPATSDDIRRELTFLYGDPCVKKKIRVQTFGGFEVFVDGVPVKFGRSKSKELLAYLIDRHGTGVNNADACMILWEDAPAGPAIKSYLRTVVADLRASLQKAGAGEILRKGFNCLSVNTDLLDCDSYRFLEGDPQAVNSYRHNYLPGYSWAEFSVAVLEDRF